MSQEGDIKPVVRRVRPYKTLLINLPAKSFGFWVLANTKIDACQYYEENTDAKLVKAETVDKVYENEDKTNLRSKRSTKTNGNSIDNSEIANEGNRLDEYDVVKTGNVELDKRIQNLNHYLREIHNALKKLPLAKVKRQTFQEGPGAKKIRRQLLKIRKDFRKIDEENKPLLGFIGNILQYARNGARHLGNEKFRTNLKLHGNKIGKRHNTKGTENIKHYQLVDKEQLISKKVSRTRRNIVNDNYDNHDNGIENHENVKIKEDSSFENNLYEVKNMDLIEKSLNAVGKLGNNENDPNNNHEDVINDDLVMNNEVNQEDKDDKKLWKVLYNIQNELNEISEDKSRRNQSLGETEDKSKESGKIIVNTEFTDDGATINFKEKPNTGWVKSAFENLFYVLNDMNEHINRVWDALSLFN